MEELAAPDEGAIRIGPFGSALKKHEYSDSGIRVLGIEDVLPNELVSDNRKYIPEQKYRELRQYSVKAGDVLVTNMGTVGRTCVVPDELETSIISSHLIKISLDLRSAWPSYISWMLNFCPLVTTQIRAKCHGAIMAGFNSGLLKQLHIPLPPLPEQRRIADVLDRADVLRAKRRAALALLDNLAESIFIDMFGDPATNPKSWPTERLASLVRDKDTINYGVVQPGDDVPDGVPLIRVGDLLEGGVKQTALKRIALSIERAYKRSRLRGDEILVSCVGSIGVVALADESVAGFNIARAVARVPLSEQTDRFFVAAYLRTSFVQSYFTNELRTVSQPTLNIKQLSETKVMLPPGNLQREFAHRVAAVEQLKRTHRASLAEMDALFGSLLHRAYRGEL